MSCIISVIYSFSAIYSINYPLYLLFLIGLVGLVILFIIERQWYSLTFEKLGKAFKKIIVLKPRSIFLFILISFAISGIILALTDPVKRGKEQKIDIKGVDMMICLDISNSMMTEDVAPNRLDNAKKILNTVLDNLDGDRIGIVTFAGNALNILPLSTDYITAKEALEQSTPSSISNQGTNIGLAVEKAIKGFPKNEIANKMILLITDGEDHQDGYEDAIKLAKEQKIPIHTITIGTTAGGVVPYYQNDQKIGDLTDPSGKTVVSKVNTSIAKQIASETKGTYIGSTSTAGIVNSIIKETNKLIKTGNKVSVLIGFEHYFIYFVVVALILLLVEWLFYYLKN